jgi:hypothetical protein
MERDTFNFEVDISTTFQETPDHILNEELLRVYVVNSTAGCQGVVELMTFPVQSKLAYALNIGALEETICQTVLLQKPDRTRFKEACPWPAFDSATAATLQNFTVDALTLKHIGHG